MNHAGIRKTKTPTHTSPLLLFDGELFAPPSSGLHEAYCSIKLRAPTPHRAFLCMHLLYTVHSDLLLNTCCRVFYEALPSTDPNSFSWARVRISLYRISASLYFPCLRKQDACRGERIENNILVQDQMGWLNFNVAPRERRASSSTYFSCTLRHMKNYAGPQSLPYCLIYNLSIISKTGQEQEAVDCGDYAALMV